MRMARVTVCLTFLLALPALAADEKKEDANLRVANLLINGSFEDGPDPGEFKPLDEDADDIKGWVVTRGQIDYIGTHWGHADGKRSLDLGGSPGYGGVAQTFA